VALIAYKVKKARDGNGTDPAYEHQTVL